MMGPTTLAELLREPNVVRDSAGLRMTVRANWVVDGEDRLSYTTLIRLVECCRELHWVNDVEPCLDSRGIDSIVRTCQAEFLQPVSVGSTICISYDVSNIGNKSYTLRFTIRVDMIATDVAVVDLVCVFYDPVARKSTVPPNEVISRLHASRNARTSTT